MPATVQQLIDRARIRHWSFNDVQMPDGAIVQFTDEKQRAVLLAVIDACEALIGSSQEIETEGTATLIAVDDAGAGYFTTTVEDGYAIRFEGGVPYIDTSQAFISDPFGEFGEVPGLPLPEDILRIIAVVARNDNDNWEKRVEILEENIAIARGGSTSLRAFVNGNRLIPQRFSESDIWSTVTSIKLSLVICPEITALADEILLPKACTDVLTAYIAEFLAFASRTCPKDDKARFERQRKEAEALLASTADEILSQVTSSNVVHRR